MRKLRSLRQLGVWFLVSGGLAVPTALGYSYLWITGEPPIFSVPYTGEPWFTHPRVVVLVDSPLWEEHGTDVRELAVLVEESVHAWTSIETTALDLKFALFQAEGGGCARRSDTRPGACVRHLR